MNFPFKKPAPGSAEQPEPTEAADVNEDPEDEALTYGLRFGKLTQIGNMWIDLDEMLSVDLDVPSITMRSRHEIEMDDEHADLLLRFLRAGTA